MIKSIFTICQQEVFWFFQENEIINLWESVSCYFQLHMILFNSSHPLNAEFRTA